MKSLTVTGCGLGEGALTNTQLDGKICGAITKTHSSLHHFWVGFPNTGFRATLIYSFNDRNYLILLPKLQTQPKERQSTKITVTYRCWSWKKRKNWKIIKQLKQKEKICCLGYIHTVCLFFPQWLTPNPFTPSSIMISSVCFVLWTMTTSKWSCICKTHSDF